jgi:hypothetical protein
MKYLLRVRPAVAMMPGMTAELLRRHATYIADLIREGRADCSYAFAGGGGGVAIINAERNEDLQEVMLRCPIGHMFEWEFVPLIPAVDSIERLARAFDEAVAAARDR